MVYGSDAILTVRVTSEVSLNTIKWQKVSSGGTPIDLSITSPKYTQSDIGPDQVTLTIKNVDFTDSGNYLVEVSNLAGITSTSNQVSLNVTGGTLSYNHKQKAILSFDHIVYFQN